MKNPKRKSSDMKKFIRWIKLKKGVKKEYNVNIHQQPSPFVESVLHSILEIKRCQKK